MYRGFKHVAFVIVLSAALLNVVLPTFAFAGNTEDTPWDFYLSNQGETDGTNWREKNDTSPVYFGITELKMPRINLYVDGSSRGSGDGKNVTVGGMAVAYRKGQYSIHSNVREFGYRYARVTTWASDGDSCGGAYGQWSPDSKYAHTSLN